MNIWDYALLFLSALAIAIASHAVYPIASIAEYAGRITGTFVLLLVIVQTGRLIRKAIMR